MAKTKIEWCEMVWNPIRGCSRVSAGCDHCYAERHAARFCGPGRPWEGFVKRVHGAPHWTGRVELVERLLTLPLRWRERLKDGFHSAEERRRAIRTGICQRLSHRQCATTPIPFRDLLLSIARTARSEAP